MSSTRSPDNRLDDIVDACGDCVAWTRNITAAEIVSNQQLFLALCRLVEIIGEAANHLPTAYRTEMSSIPWRKIVATRNLFVHRYWIIDRGLMLLTIHNDLPKLVAAIQEWRTSKAYP